MSSSSSASAAQQAATKAFDLIDGNHIGQAEMVIEAAQKKFPEHHALKAAAAMVAFRNGHTIDAAKSASVLAVDPQCTDPGALDAIAHVLQQTSTFAPLAAMYERVIALIPDSTSVQENLFHVYIRLGKFTEAQRTAMALNKKRAAPMYQAWTVMSMLAQVPIDVSDHLLLKLSTKMLESNVLTAPSTTTMDTCKTYLDVLVQQGRLDDALTFIVGPKGHRLGLTERRLQLCREVLLLQGQLKAACAVALVLWKRNSDNWDAFMWHVDSVSDSRTAASPDFTAITLAVKDGESTELSVTVEPCDLTLDAVLLTAKELQKTELEARPSKKRRGPFLAELEILLRMHAEQPLAQAAVAYAEWFYNKPVCFMDLVTYVHANSEVRCRIVDHLRTNVAPKVAGLALHHVSSLCLRLEALDVVDSGDAADHYEKESALIASCVEGYRAAESLSEGLAWSEEGLCDAYISCAVTICVKAYARTLDRSWLEKVLSMIEKTKRTLNNPSWLLLAVQCQRLLYRAVDVRFTKQLDFKSVQCDTMFTTGFYPLLDSCAVDELEAWVREAYLRFFSVSGKDSSLLRVKVFKYFSWPVWRDLLQFENKLLDSVVRVETLAYFSLLHTRQCQTYKYVVQHLLSTGVEVGRTLQMLGQSQTPQQLRCNEDTLVLRATLSDYVHSDRASHVVETLLGHSQRPSMKDIGSRRSAATSMLLLFALLHDHALREYARQQKANAPKPSKGQSTPVPTESDTNRPLLQSPEANALLLESMTEDLALWPVLLRPLIPCLVKSLEATVAPTQWNEAIERFRANMTTFVEKTRVSSAADDSSTTPVDTVSGSDALHTLLEMLIPSGYAVSTLLQTAHAQLVPVAKIAVAVRETIVVPVKSVIAATLRDAPDLSALVKQKLQSVDRYLDDVATDCTAAAKRK